MNTTTTLGPLAILMLDPAGPAISDPADTRDVLGAAFGHRADVVVVPVERLSERFFDLRTRFAGEFVQKLVNYRIMLVVLGDIAPYVERSDALAGFVYESNRGRHVWFLPDFDELVSRIRTVTG